MKNKLVAMMFGAVLVLGACGGGNDDAGKDDTGTDTNGGETASVDAEAVIQQSCVGCHGGNLEGGAGPAIDKAGATHSEEEIHDIVVNGKGGMPPVLKGEEADAVAKYLAEQK